MTVIHQLYPTHFELRLCHEFICGIHLLICKLHSPISLSLWFRFLLHLQPCQRLSCLWRDTCPLCVHSRLILEPHWVYPNSKFFVFSHGTRFASSSALGILWLIPLILLTSLLLLIAVIDIMSWCIPDHLNYLLLWLGLAFSVWPIFTTVDCRSAVLGAILGYLILWALSLLFNLVYQKEGIGRGDFKLLAALGTWTGWQMLIFVLFFASALALIYIVANSLYRKRIITIIPFAPFLSLAGWLSFIAHITGFF